MTCRFPPRAWPSWPISWWPRGEFIPQLQAQLADLTALRDDAAARGWHPEVARHSRVIASIQGHLKRLTR